MKAVEIKKGIYWVGGIDQGLEDFHGYRTQRGSTYNAYLIFDEKIVLVDTVKHYLHDEMLARISSVIDPAKIDYIVSNHTEMDHSGCLPKITKVANKAIVVASPNGQKGLGKHFDQEFNFKVVNSGDSINIGKRNLQFVLTPMVHWPDSMVTYIPEDKLLLSNDAFGQHIASSERFDDQLDFDIVIQEATKYYANIVFPFGAQVKKALQALSGLEIDMIAPSHGIIWRKNLGEIIQKYKGWADNTTEERAIVVYDTMWGSTEIIAKTISNVFINKGIPAELLNLKKNHISDIMTKVLTAKYICVGSSTLNNSVLPTVAAFLNYMQGLGPKNRIGLGFGSYGWGGQSIAQIQEVLKSCGFQLLDSIKVQYVPKRQALAELSAKLEKVI
ncbi:MAG: FprA family A-type flavoprotein [Candidatus Omnitrophica bacterium]|nr:FprA family A-type flavoprotein [Candidatus Omnitrophota bacterium]